MEGPLTASSAPVVRTTGGEVRGTSRDGVAAFLGVPYAAPPFGPRRFGPPAPARWDGVREVTAYGASAPQPDRQFTLIPEPVIAGEECLNLNVFTPDPGGRLPVLVWIHGGGFTAGCNASPWYRGDRFCRDGVVVVSVNYRLGCEGFLTVPGAPVNRALLDWVAALRWVQDNIAAFGGDPARVTIAGQSAGGVACATLLASPLAAGLFHRALLMSGVGVGAPSLDDAAQVTAAVAADVGVPATLEALREVPPARLVQAQDSVGRAGLGMTFTPVRDDETLPRSVEEAVAAGVGADVPVMVGATREEAVATMQAAADRVDEDRLRRRLDRLGLRGSRAEAYLRAHDGEPPWRVLGQATTDAMFRVPALRLAEGRAAQREASPTWLYEFRWGTKVRSMGAVHCLDVPFAFDLLDADGVREVAGDDPPQQLADEVHGAWVRFVTDGDPGWPRYDSDRRATQLFDEASGVVDDANADLRELWLR